VDVWPTTYLGAEPTPLNKAIGRIVLLAGVRRIRRPGSKFDTIMVLEGPQGGGKSTAIKMLAGPENFSDQELLTLDAKAQMEALEGVWILEIAELEGISRADTAKVKAFASRSDDNARPAYARFKEKRPRQTIFIGTTNDDKYLRDMTGNRRFWPVKIGQIDLEALARDRDQLWALPIMRTGRIDSTRLSSSPSAAPFASTPMRSCERPKMRTATQ
jgi:predicted P-loop ATPase